MLHWHGTKPGAAYPSGKYLSSWKRHTHTHTHMRNMREIRCCACGVALEGARQFQCMSRHGIAKKALDGSAMTRHADVSQRLAILAEGAIALSVTLSGGALFAS